jgi:tRNA (cytidine/uridine-2'-O-)-methyltransferase
MSALFFAVMFHVVLVEPEIPPNTGNIGRLCVAAGATLHLVHPLGFQINDRELKRAGLDYWPHLELREWADWEAFVASGPPLLRCFFLTTKSTRSYLTQRFEPGDFLVFGRETRGLPETLIAANADRALTIPMAPAARSLNLATAVGIVLYEAMRQNPP